MALAVIRRNAKQLLHFYRALTSSKKEITMGLRITRLRIKNFRSIESLEIVLGDNNLIFGQNNAGKSNILKAINVALNTTYYVSEQDIFVKKGEALKKDKSAIIDVMISPDKDESGRNSFSAFWTTVFSEKWIFTDDNSNDFVGIRTIIQYDVEFDNYKCSKHVIKQWGESADAANCKKQSFTQDMMKYISCFYMDAHRDITEDIRDKKSFFGRATSNSEIPSEIVEKLEQQLDAINKEIVDNTPTLKETESELSEIGSLVGSATSALQIEPLSRKISDLHKGIDVKFQDGSGPVVSLSEHGMGTRSWVSFLTLGAYVKHLVTCIQKQDPDAEMFTVLTMEEPEAHLHSCAQKKLYKQIMSFTGQKIVSTHSSNILAQADIKDFIHIYKKDGSSFAHRIDKSKFQTEELAKIQREFIRSKGDLLFSSAVILAEGITEELAIPIYFTKFFNCDPSSLGITILGIGGKNYHSFLKLFVDYGIPFYIFSDGETNTIATVNKALVEATGKELEQSSNVIVLDNGEYYEQYLVSSGYGEYIVEALNEYEHILRMESDPEGATRDPEQFFDRFIATNNHKVAGQKSTGEHCPTCGLPKKEQILYEYDGEDGRKRAIVDCLKKDKAKYAECIAEKIVSISDGKPCIPSKLIELFEEVKKCLNVRGGE